MGKQVVVGLTGSFGTGKSTVAKILKRLGVRKVVDADKLAHEVYWRNHPIGSKIKSLFGIKGVLNRRKVAREAFRSFSKRRQLEALVHPYVLRRIREELKEIQSGIVIVEVPLLFESGFDQLCDKVILVAAPRRLIEKRLVQKGFNKKQVQERLKAQLPQSEKKKRSGFIILNSGSKKVLIQRTKSIWKRLNQI